MTDGAGVGVGGRTSMRCELAPEAAAEAAFAAVSPAA